MTLGTRPEILRHHFLMKAKERKEQLETEHSYEERRKIVFPNFGQETRFVAPTPDVPLSLAILFENKLITDLIAFSTEQEFVETYGLLPRHMRVLIDMGRLGVAVPTMPHESGGPQLTLEAFARSNVDYSPIINEHLIYSDKIHSDLDYGVLNNDYMQGFRSRLTIANLTNIIEFYAEHYAKIDNFQRLQQTWWQELSNAGLTDTDFIHDSRSARALSVGSQTAILKEIYALGYDDLLSDARYYDGTTVTAMGSLNYLDRFDSQKPFPRIYSGRDMYGYSHLLQQRGDIGQDLPNMSAFPTDLALTLVRFGDWKLQDQSAAITRSTKPDNQMNSLQFAKMNPAQDPDRYFDDFLDLWKEVQTSTAPELYSECRRLFERKEAGKAVDKRLDNASQATYELKNILGSYDTLNKWSNRILRTLFVVTGTSAIESLAEPLFEIAGDTSGDAMGELRKVGGEFGHPVNDEFMNEFEEWGENTDLLPAVQKELEATERAAFNTAASVGAETTLDSIKKRMGHVSRNYLWRPAKRGELKLLWPKMRHYKNEKELKSRLFPFIMTVEERSGR